jgi:hypothetical protein
MTLMNTATSGVVISIKSGDGLGAWLLAADARVKFM